MPPPDHSPIARQPEPFDPRTLRRSVIAIPLREAIEDELRLTKEFSDKNAKLLKGHNAVVFFLGKTVQEAANSRKRALKRLERVVKELRGVDEFRNMEE